MLTRPTLAIRADALSVLDGPAQAGRIPARSPDGGEAGAGGTDPHTPGQPLNTMSWYSG